MAANIRHNTTCRMSQIMLTNEVRLIFFLYSIISPIIAVGRLRIHFHDSGIKPDKEEFITDNSPRTCATFNNSDDTNSPRYTNFRIQVAHHKIDYANVTLIGTNLGCGHNLYVMPLSTAETEKWTGRWTTCPVTEETTYKGKERCSYSCQCRGSCEEIQVLKIINDNSWNVCHICITGDYLDLSGCTADSAKTSGVYSINPISESSDCIDTKDVYCDMENDGGGWTVILRRKDGSVNFNRDWEDYKLGFGSLNGEVWAGNELIHQLTNDGRTYSLKVDLISYYGSHIYAIFRNFSIGPESDNYRLHIMDFDNNSNASDTFMVNHTGCMFCTEDVDNDRQVSSNIAKEVMAPWWYCNVCVVTLTGQYGSYLETGVGVRWTDPWKDYQYSRFAVMKIRPN